MQDRWSHEQRIAAAVRQTYDRAVALLPALREASIANTWAGFVDSTPDGVLAIGEVPQLPGFILAAGFSGHGFGIGPGAATATDTLGRSTLASTIVP